MTTRYLHEKEWDCILTWHHKKFNSKWIKDLNVRAKALRFFEENIGINLSELELDNSVNMIPKAKETTKI